METEEDEIRNTLPEIYSLINATAQNVNWKEVQEDFASLNWLQFDITKAISILENALDIVDAISLKDPDEQPRFNLLQLNRVVLFLNRLVFEITSDKKSMKSLSSLLKKKIGSFLFFKSAKNSMYHAEDEELAPILKQCDSIFKVMKENLISVFSHLDQQFKQDAYKSLASFLDDEFYNNIILTQKSKLKQNQECKRIIENYDKTSTSGRTNGGMWSSTTNYHSARESDYFGELDEDGNRHGYGKITYFNGDKYDGY